MSTEKQADIKVFICYAREDNEIATKLYADLERAGVSPWIDTEDLKPGEKWKTVIPKMMEKSSYVLILLSSHSISKRGFVQHEIRAALAFAQDFPDSAIFIIPVRLEDCEPPEGLTDLHWVDLFPEYDAGFSKLLQVLAPEGRDALLFRKIQRLTEEYKRLQQEKGLETESDALTRLETEMTEVQAQRQQAEAQLHELHKPPPKQEQPRKVVTIWRKAEDDKIIALRSEPQTVSRNEAIDVFKLHVDTDGWWRPREYIQNEYEDQGDVVIDHATGLMWQKSGSERKLIYEQAQNYVEQLNQKRFTGYGDWRLPTIPELMSLLEFEKQSTGLYIDLIFDATQYWCWSADRRSPESAWLVNFGLGNVDRVYLGNFSVRCVRSLYQESPHAHQEPERGIKLKPPSQRSPEAPVIHLRSEPLTVSEDEAQKVFGLQTQRLSWGTVWRPLEYIQNDYESQDEVVIDHATSLIWQKSGSESSMAYKEAKKCVKTLNCQKFAGHNDWRLPTISELMSLLESEKQENGLYIKPIFDSTQRYCWSADLRSHPAKSSLGPAWFVHFSGGRVHWSLLTSFYYVRCVRSRK